MAYKYHKYPENGWTVTAEPDSTLYDENGSLKYEGEFVNNEYDEKLQKQEVTTYILL